MSMTDATVDAVAASQLPTTGEIDTSISMQQALSALNAARLPATLKGLPQPSVEQPLQALGTRQYGLLQGEIPLPAAVLRESALAHNLDWMRQFAARAGVSLCPHGKTTMAPQLFARQLAAGAWGMTAATASHVRSYRRWGVPRILLANQLVGPANIGLVLDEVEADPDLDFYCLVDSSAGLQQLLDAVAARELQRPLQVLLELGIPGGRTGVRKLEDAVALGREIQQAAPQIALRGIEAFEGIIAGPDTTEVEARVQQLLEGMAALTRTGCEEGWFGPGEVIVTAGGTSFFDLVAAALSGIDDVERLRPVLRSGCYLTHDSFHFAAEQPRMRARSAALWGEAPGLRNALEVWAEVQSVPEASRAICALGKRDISYDMRLPQPLWWYRPGLHQAPQPVDRDGYELVAMNDQHAYVDSGGGMDWQVGDLIGFGVAHPCTTFDKWPLLLRVDDEYRVLGGIRTYF